MLNNYSLQVRIFSGWLIVLLFFHLDLKAQSYQWSNVAIGGGGFVTALITSKTEQNLMYARTDVGGAYRWNATDSSWIPLLDWVPESETGFMGVGALAIDPQATNKVYMLVGTSYLSSGKTAILRSSDYGSTFSVTDVTSQFQANGNGMGRQNGERLAVDPNDGSILFCGSRANGLFKSTNAGVNWSRVSSLNVTTTSNGNGINFVVFDPSSGTSGSASQTLFVGVSQTGTNLYVSRDGGSSFSAVSGAPTSYMPQRAVLASDNNLYITYSDKEGPWNISSGQIWKYNISTSAWTNVTPSGYTFGFSGISVDPNNPQRLIASSINAYWTQYPNVYGDRFFLSTNGGSSWTDLVGNSGITLNPNGVSWINGNAIHWAGCIEFNPFNTNQAWVTSGNGVFTCDNVNASQTTWKFNVKRLEETVPLDIASIPGGPLLSAIGDYDGFIHTNVTQYAPRYNPSMGTTSGIAYAAGNSNVLLRVGSSMYYSTNQGTSWNQCTINGSQGKVAISEDGSTFLHCPSSSSTMYRSVNNGSSWTTANGISIQDAVPVADFVNASKFYAYDNNSGTVYVSTDGGVNFSASGNAGSGGSKIIRAVPGNEGHLWAALYNGGLTRSTNSGQSFSKINGVTYCEAVGLGKAAPGSSYYAIYIWGTVNNVTGVFQSTDEGASWVRVNDDAHQYGGPGNGQFVIGDMNVYGRVYMSTVGRGIVYGELQTNQPPTVSLTSPSNNATVCSGSSITLTANASDSDGSITQVDFYDGSTLLSSVTSSPYTYNWSNVSAGTHTLTAKATDNQNAVTTSTAIAITVNATPSAPGVTTPVTYCQGSTSMALTASGQNLQWYTVASGGSGSGTAPVPSTVSVDTINYYASQTVNNCEGLRAQIAVYVDNCTITGINNGFTHTNANVYPNPYLESFSIHSSGSFTYLISDLSGNILETGQGHDNVNVGSVLKPGLYIVRIETSDGTVVFEKITRQ